MKSVENAEKNPKVIDNWIESISELHRCKPPATVHYSRWAIMSAEHQVRGWQSPGALSRMIKMSLRGRRCAEFQGSCTVYVCRMLFLSLHFSFSSCPKTILTVPICNIQLLAINTLQKENLDKSEESRLILYHVLDWVSAVVAHPSAQTSNSQQLSLTPKEVMVLERFFRHSAKHRFKT